MKTVTITISEDNEKRIAEMAKEANMTSEEFLSGSIEASFTREVEDESLNFPVVERAEDFLTPEQRLDAVAEILATIALRAVKADQAKQANQPKK